MDLKGLIRIFCIATSLCLLLAIAPATLAEPPSGTGLFTDTTPTAALDRSGDATIVRTRYVNIDLAALPGALAPADAGAEVTLNLFDDVSLTGVLDRVERKPNGLVWNGHLKDVELSTVNLVQDGDLVGGSINYPAGMYVIRSTGNGAHAIYEIDQSKYGPEIPMPVTGPALPDTYTPPPDARADDGSEIDVMVLYTPAVAAQLGSDAAVQNLINVGIAQTNASYQQSNINQRVRLVHSERVSYTEPGTGSALADWQQILNDVTNGAGALSGVAALRNAYAADEVSLFINYTAVSTCGIGWYMDTVTPQMAPHAYNVVQQSCVDGYYSFAHEMGHNMGAQHDWYVADNTSVPFSYVHGRVNLTQKWRTIMAYNDICLAQSPGFSCTRIQYWSNPGLTYGGYSLGVAGGTNSNRTACYQLATNPACDADNHLVLNNTALTVANFRVSMRYKTYLSIVSNPAAQGFQPAPGKWLSGNTYHEFYVTPDKAHVQNFAVYVSVSGCGNYKITHTVTEPLENNHFSWGGAFYASGTFNSATSASATDGLSNLNIPNCGTVNGGPWTQNYAWNSSAQPDLQAEVTGPESIEPATGRSDVEVVRLR